MQVLKFRLSCSKKQTKKLTSNWRKRRIIFLWQNVKFLPWKSPPPFCLYPKDWPHTKTSHLKKRKILKKCNTNGHLSEKNYNSGLFYILAIKPSCSASDASNRNNGKSGTMDPPPFWVLLPPTSLMMKVMKESYEISIVSPWMELPESMKRTHCGRRSPV